MVKIEEIFIPIPNYEGIYEVSNFGNIKNKNKVLRCNIRSSTCNYMVVNLQVDHQRKSFLVHRLVAIAFLPNPENKPTVNHIDGNKHNNCVYNLEWATRSENMKHAFDTGLNKQSRKSCNLGESSVNAKIKEADVSFIKTSDMNQKDLAKMFGISQTQISRIKNGKRWQHIKR